MHGATKERRALWALALNRHARVLVSTNAMLNADVVFCETARLFPVNLLFICVSILDDAFVFGGRALEPRELASLFSFY
jgi:hypothetical protein